MAAKKDDKLIELQLELRNNLMKEFVSIRREKGMTQSDISDATGILRPNLSRMENCKYNPTLDMMVRMAYSLDKKIVFSFEDL